jgi:hypothetical protein
MRDISDSGDLTGDSNRCPLIIGRADLGIVVVTCIGSAPQGLASGGPQGGRRHLPWPSPRDTTNLIDFSQVEWVICSQRNLNTEGHNPSRTLKGRAVPKGGRYGPPPEFNALTRGDSRFQTFEWLPGQDSNLNASHWSGP